MERGQAAQECGSVLCKGGEVIAAFLDDQRRQPDHAAGLAKPVETLRRDTHLRLRVFAIDGAASVSSRRRIPRAFPAVFVGGAVGDVVNVPLAALRAPVG